MTLALDFPQCSHSFLGRLDPRWKMAALILAALFCALLTTLSAVLGAWAFSLAIVALARLPVRWLFLRLGSVALVLSCFAAWLPFVHAPGDDRWELGWLSLSLSGLTLAAVLLFKALAVVSLMLALLATAPLQDTFKAAHDLRVPGILIQLLLLTHRFVFLVAEEFARLRIALRVRGFRSRGNWQTYRTIGQVAGTLLVRSHDRAERVSQAMRCRGFDGCFRSLNQFSTRPIDVLSFVIIVGSAAAILIWDILRRG
jgi:cobalt/nickel transport system permease protein